MVENCAIVGITPDDLAEVVNSFRLGGQGAGNVIRGKGAAEGPVK